MPNERTDFKTWIIWVTCITQEGNKEEKQNERVDTSASEDPRARPPADSLQGCCGDIHTLMEAGSRHGGGEQQSCLIAHPGCDGALTPPLTPTTGPRPLQGAFKRGRRK